MSHRTEKTNCRTASYYKSKHSLSWKFITPKIGFAPCVQAEARGLIRPSWEKHCISYNGKIGMNRPSLHRNIVLTLYVRDNLTTTLLLMMLKRDRPTKAKENNLWGHGVMSRHRGVSRIQGTGGGAKPQGEWYVFFII